MVTQAILKAIIKVTDPLKRRLELMIARALLQLVDDSGPSQMVQVVGFGGEPIQATHYQPYGFYSHPPAGARCILVYPAGDASQPVVLVAHDPTSRPKGSVLGEAGLINLAGARVALVGPAVAITGNLAVAGDVSDTAGSLAALRAEVAAIKAAYNAHIHTTGGVASTPPVPLVP